jgi:hypothetical protein
VIDDMKARKLGPATHRNHIAACKRFAAFLQRSPDTATPDDVRAFMLHLAEDGTSIGRQLPDHDRGEVSVPGHRRAENKKHKAGEEDKANCPRPYSQLACPGPCWR